MQEEKEQRKNNTTLLPADITDHEHGKIATSIVVNHAGLDESIQLISEEISDLINNSTGLCPGVCGGDHILQI